MLSDYSLLLAQKSVQDYGAKDALIAQHQQAMECCDCEDFLESGIKAYRWLKQADETLRAAAQQGIDVSEECVPALASLYRGWLLPCEHAEQQIQLQHDRDFSVKNLDAFREACEVGRT